MKRTLFSALLFFALVTVGAAQTWVQAYQAIWSTYSATNTPGSPGSALAGSSFIDVAGAWYTASSSNGVVAEPHLASAPSGTLLDFGPLVSPVLTTVNEEAISVGHLSSTTNALTAVCNYQSSGTTGLAAIASSNGLYVFAVASSSSAVQLGHSAFSGGSWTAGHQYSLSLQTNFSVAAQVTLTASITDLTASAVIASISQTETQSTFSAPLWAAVSQPGEAGTIFYDTTQSALYDSTTVYNQESVLPTPAQAPINATSYTVSLQGVGTTWTSGTTFTVSGLAGASVVGKTVTSGTLAVIQIATGASTGTLTISDGTVNGPLIIELIVCPQISVASQGPGTATLSYGGPPLAANGPYTINLYRSTLSGGTPGDGYSVLVSSQSGLGVNSTPANVTDTTATPGTVYYYDTVTDAASQTAIDAQIGLVFLSTKVVNAAAVGDSTAQGVQTTTGTNVLVRQVTAAIPGTSSGLTPPYTFTFSGGAGSGAAVTNYSVVGGVLQWVTVSHGSGYTLAGGPPTLTMTAGSGTVPSFTVDIGGGWPVALQNDIQNSYGYPSYSCFNIAVGGTQSNQWCPHGTGSASNSGYLLEQSLAFCAANSVTQLYVALGTNDALYGETVSQYQSNLALMITAALAHGITKVILVPPTWTDGTLTIGYTPAVLSVLQQYQTTAIPALVAEFPGSVIAGPNMYSLLLANPSGHGPDGRHMNDFGYSLMASAMELPAALACGLAVAVPSGGNNPNGLYLEWDLEKRIMASVNYSFSF